MASSIASLSSSSAPFGSVLHHQNENNILKLKLKKPKSWNWELSTSKSSAHIDFPRILLYDSDDKLLADVDEANLIVNGKENEPHTPVHLSLSDISKRSYLQKSRSFTISNLSLNSPRSSSLNIERSLGNSSKADCSSRSDSKCTRSHSTSSPFSARNVDIVENESIKSDAAVPSIEKEANQPEVPIYIYSAKGLVKRDFNAKEFDAIRNRQNSLDSGSKTDTTLTRDQKVSAAKSDLCAITEGQKTNVYRTLQTDCNPLAKCKSVADISANGVTRKKSRRKMRRTKSVNSSSSTKCQSQNLTQNAQLSSSSESIAKPTSQKVYRIEKCAAGSLIVPDEKPHRRVRRRHRSKSSDKVDRTDLQHELCDKTNADSFMSNVLLSHELDSNSNSTSKNSAECINDINEMIVCSNGETIRIENNQTNMKNGRASSANSDNNVNNGIDRKQKKAQLNRKVSFVQFNCENGNDACNDWIDVQQRQKQQQQQQQQHLQPNVYLNKNGMCMNARTNARKKVFHGKIKKSASVASFCNNYPTMSSSDSDDNDTYAIPPVRHKKRRVSQRHKSSTNTYQHHDDQAVSHLQRNSDNVINNSSNKESLVKFQENLASFQNQWTFDKCERNRDAFINELFENGHRNSCESTHQCEIPTTSLTVTPIQNGDNDVYDNVTASKNTNKNNHLNYRYQKVYQDGTDKTGYFTNTFFINTIENEHGINGNTSNELKEKLKYKQNQQRHVNNMGSNVSRNTAKGLSGRRTQSSGDLANGNAKKINEREHQIAIEAQANDPNFLKDDDQVDSICPPPPPPSISQLNCQLTTVKNTERNKFFGSLPNHLDSDETYRENVYNKSNMEAQKRPLETSKFDSSIQYPSSSPRVFPPAYSQANHHQNMQSATSNGIDTTIHLKLAINRSNLDVGCDQGYGSERSPEDELPPILSIPYQTIEPQYHQKLQRNNGTISESDFNFITKDCCFSVQVIKNERGLGISVYGGTDSNVSYRGLIRIKRLFPNQAAWSTGMLQPGDILLEANDTPLTGLTNHEALEVLRTAPNVVLLKVCRPHDEQFRKLSPPADPPRPPQRSLHTTTTFESFEPQSPVQTTFAGEFEITMVKQQGSLGFTLRKEDESVLGHYVRALIRDPAASDGRIKAGDKIVAVNDVPLCPMTHEEAVIFLRQAKDRVKLRLYRDSSLTPIASISPSTSEQYISATSGKPKACLRPEAMNLLIDLAHKNRKQSCDSYSTGSSVQSSSASPRRLRRNNNNKVNSSDNNTEFEKSATKSFNYQNKTYTVQSSVCSDSESSTISQSSFVGPTMRQPQHNDDNVLNSTFTVDSQLKQQQQQQQQQQPSYQQRPYGEESEYYNEEELGRLMDVDEYNGSTTEHQRPNHLDLAGNSGYTPVVSRKPMFQFSAVNGYELNNLDNEALDAPVYNTMCNNPNLNTQQYQDGINSDFTSLPCETFLMSSRVNSDSAHDNGDFSYKNPMYQSAHVQVKSKPIVNDEEIYHAENSEEGSKNLLKWKGVMFGIDEADKTMAAANAQTPETTTTSSEPDSSCATMIEINAITADNAKDSMNRIAFDDKTHEIITVELSRGWNSRLGFSLRNEPNSMHTAISAIYSDSVAAKDGRLRVGDIIMMVNDEPVEGLTTAEIIDLLRIIRGSIVLVVKRPRFSSTEFD